MHFALTSIHFCKVVSSSQVAWLFYKLLDLTIKLFKISLFDLGFCKTKCWVQLFICVLLSNLLWSEKQDFISGIFGVKEPYRLKTFTEHQNVLYVLDSHLTKLNPRNLHVVMYTSSSSLLFISGKLEQWSVHYELYQ